MCDVDNIMYVQVTFTFGELGIDWQQCIYTFLSTAVQLYIFITIRFGELKGTCILLPFTGNFVSLPSPEFESL